MKIWLPRILAIFLIVILSAYVITREIQDPWLLGEADEAEDQEMTDKEQERIAEDSRKEEAVPSRQSEQDVSGLHEKLRTQLAKTHAVLSTRITERLQDHSSKLVEEYSAEQSRVEATRDRLLQQFGQIREESGDSLENLDSIITNIQENTTQLDEAARELMNARELWRNTYRQLSSLKSSSGDVMDESNYNFIEYEVGRNESLSSIVRELKAEHDLEREDLESLIHMFNDVQTRIPQTFNKRNTATRVVSNETLRIPLPKSTTTLLEEQGISRGLEEQRDAMENARERYASVRKSIADQVSELKSFEERLNALREIASDIDHNLENFQLENLPDWDPQLTEEQRHAWQDFNQAFMEHSLADGQELTKAAEQRLENASRKLFEAYRSASSPTDSESGISLESGDITSEIQWYQRFIERYAPQDSKENAK